MQVALIFGVAGALKNYDFCNITTNNIKDLGSLLLINIPKTKRHAERKFMVDGEFYYNIFKKYEALRPSNIETNRFFLQYIRGKCTQQVMGINKFGSMPKKIAQYLKLPDAESYTGHSFRLTSAKLVSDCGIKLTTVECEKSEVEPPLKCLKKESEVNFGASTSKDCDPVIKIEDSQLLPPNENDKPDCSDLTILGL